MIKKLFGRRRNLNLSIVVVLAVGLILTWALTRTEEQNNPQTLLAAGPGLEGKHAEAGFPGTAMAHRDNQKIMNAGGAAAGISENHTVKGNSAGDESEDVFKPEIKPPLNVRLAGILIDMGKSARATIVDLTTGRQGLYRVGDSMLGATIRKIDPDRVVLEKDGAFQVLRVAGGGGMTGNSPVANAEGDRPAFTEESGELPFFEPIENLEGPPVDESVEVKELPFFEPITNTTGPPVDPNGNYEDLPEFIPYESKNGPEPE